MAKMGQPLGEEGGCTMGIIWGGWGRGLGWGVGGDTKIDL